MDRNSLRDAQETLLRILPDGKLRYAYMEMFATCVEVAQRQGADQWGITLEEDRVRLVVGSLVACTLHSERLWLALDAAEVTAVVNLLIESPAWEATPDHNYTALPTVSGYYTLADGGRLWTVIRPACFLLIAKAAEKYGKLQKPSQESHSPGVLKLLESALNRDMPHPRY